MDFDQKGKLYLIQNVASMFKSCQTIHLEYSEKLILRGFVTVGFWLSESEIFDELSLIVVVAKTGWDGFAGSENKIKSYLGNIGV